MENTTNLFRKLEKLNIEENQEKKAIVCARYNADSSLYVFDTVREMIHFVAVGPLSKSRKVWWKEVRGTVYVEIKTYNDQRIEGDIMRKKKERGKKS